jgi:predicted ATPase
VRGRRSISPGKTRSPRLSIISAPLTGRSRPAALLAPVYGWFAEGFDTADLKEAKTLLDKLTEPAIAAEG